MCVRPSCRDKGWTWGRVGALCLSWWQRDSLEFREAKGSSPNEDKHKAPASAPPRPLSLQDAETLLITPFGRENSSGYGEREIHIHIRSTYAANFRFLRPAGRGVRGTDSPGTGGRRLHYLARAHIAQHRIDPLPAHY